MSVSPYANLKLPADPGAGLPLTRELAWVRETVRATLCDGPSRGGVDLFDSCDLLELDRHTSVRTYVTALALGLEQALGRTVDIRAPGAPETSFDEAWLLRLVACSQACDAESVAFLISSRVPHPRRAAVAFLVEGLSSRLPEG